MLVFGEHICISLHLVTFWIFKDFFDLCIDLLLELVKTAGAACSWRGIVTAGGVCLVPGPLVFLLPLVRRLLVAVLLLLSLHTLSLHLDLTKIWMQKSGHFQKVNPYHFLETETRSQNVNDITFLAL